MKALSKYKNINSIAISCIILVFHYFVPATDAHIHHLVALLVKHIYQIGTQVVTNLSPQTLTTHHTKWHLFFLSWKHAPNVLNIDKTTFSTQLQLSNGMQRCSCNKKKQGRIFVAFNWLLIFSIDLHNPRKKSIWFVLLVTCTSFGPRAIFTRHIYIYIYMVVYKQAIMSKVQSIFPLPFCCFCFVCDFKFQNI